MTDARLDQAMDRFDAAASAAGMPDLGGVTTDVWGVVAIHTGIPRQDLVDHMGATAHAVVGHLLAGADPLDFAHGLLSQGFLHGWFAARPEAEA